jgi:hypothetical protein
MPFPGFPLDASKTNATPTTNDHPDHHNDLAVAVNDLQGQIDALVLNDVDLQQQINNLANLVALVGNPTGTVEWGPWTVAPPGYLFMGASHPNADTLYPALWAIVPASWKSGTTLNLPPLDDRVIMGGGTLGASGGANTHTLSVDNLASHFHFANHTHTYSGNTGGVSSDHTHFFSVSSSGAGGHSHVPGSGSSFLVIGTGGGGWDPAVNQGFGGTGTTSFVGDHAHSVSGSTGGISANHSHFFSGTTSDTSAHVASTGSGTPVDHTPAHLRLRAIIKT